jgi:hypothetical protein
VQIFKPEASNNCVLDALCVDITVILFGFSTLPGSSF